MKKIIYTLMLAAFAVIGLSSCDAYLDRTPLDSDNDATHWTSEAAIENYSWTFYDYLDEISYGTGWTRGQYYAEAFTDDYSCENFSEFTKNVPNSSGSWNTPYSRIREANVMLNRIDMIPNLSETAANHWRGVARFFRAFFHFQLVKVYGDVVWVDDEIDFSKEEEVTKPRDSRVTVMDNVVADLQFAVNHCYGPEQAATNTVNKYVAAALLSRVALYEGTWEKYHNVSGGHPETFLSAAKNAAETVINSGKYAISNDYAAMYRSLSLASSNEVLLYHMYTVANVNGGKVSKAHAQYGNTNSSTPTWGLTKSAVESYTTSEGIPIHMVPDYDDKTLAGIFENRDKRLSATVTPTILPVTNLAWNHGILSTTGYWTEKYTDLSREQEMLNTATWNAPLNDTDGPIFQYSEVLLNYAEACAELGSCTDADLNKSVNILRTNHGGIPALKVSGTGCTVNGVTITLDEKDGAPTVLIQEIRRERRVELMTDGFRHDDLMRWKLGEKLNTKTNPDGYLGASMAAIKDYCEKAGKSDDWAKIEEKNFWYNGYKSPYNTEVVNAGGATVDRVWDDKYYLEPVPSGQILLDPNLTQNPGW